MLRRPMQFFMSLCALVLALGYAIAQENASDVLAGHSFHGEAFNEGPRQAAYLMDGMGNVQFPASTENQLAQQFINQGVAQLHGFWYYEAERSFRQAAVLDPDCAIAYWGMAMANIENRKRARGLIEKAVERIDSCSPREQLYIKAYEQFCREKDESGKEIGKKDRAQRFTRDLEKIVEDFPHDIEAKAFLAVQLWMNERADLPIVSHVAVDSLIQDVFDSNPMHPAHHYRIHLWDRHKPERALKSAAECGPSLPGVAHMWHMPGHIYDKLHRYHDAVWQQEASARVDHAHMMRDRVMPDQIHNFAHNNEWLIRNLVKIGRVNDAIELAKNMSELPRHPKYNTLEKGSTKYGRERLQLVLKSYRLWPELIELSESIYLQPTDKQELQIERQRDLGVAYALTGQVAQSDEIVQALSSELESIEEQLKDLTQQSEADAATSKPSENATEDEQKAAANRKRREKKRKEQKKSLEDLQKQLKESLQAVQVAVAAAKGKWDEALKGWEDSNLDDNLLKAEWMLADGRIEDSLKLLDQEIEDRPGQLLPLAVKAHVVYQSSGADSAQPVLEEARVLASQADLSTPLLARLQPLVEELGMAQDWKAAYVPASDIGQRPDLNKLGPFRWHPYLAPDFSVENTQGSQLHLKNLSGKPSLVIFYLGFGCLHCVEQLHAFSPRAEQFRASGIDLLAISTEDLESLNTGLASYSKPLDIPLHADPELTAFKSFRCFDDFEGQPLHGTFLIDPDGHVLWQDISYEPFMDVDFALEESHRLLKLAGYGELLNEPKPQKFVGKVERE